MLYVCHHFPNATTGGEGIINGYMRGLTDKDLEVSLWVIDPESRKAENFFHQTLLHAITSNTNPQAFPCGVVQTSYDSLRKVGGHISPMFSEGFHTGRVPEGAR